MVSQRQKERTKSETTHGVQAPLAIIFHFEWTCRTGSVNAITWLILVT